MKAETKSAILAAKEYEEKRNEACKSLFLNREILAPILKYVVGPYKSLALKEIMISIDPASVKEAKKTSEKTTKRNTARYAVRCKALTPDETSVITFHIHGKIRSGLEADNLTYQVLRESFYGLEQNKDEEIPYLTESDYAVKKYDIWICTGDIPRMQRNSVSKYSITKEDLVGYIGEKKANYDLEEVIIIRCGLHTECEGLFEYLNGVFSGNMAIIGKYIDAAAQEAADTIQVTVVTDTEEKIKEAEEKGKEQGLISGLERGQKQMSQLISELIKDNRINDLKKATGDEKLLKKLLREYGLIDELEE